MHANCGFCHRPDGNFANFDLRYATNLKDMNICNVGVTKGAIASAPGKTKIMDPGQAMDSVMWLLMNESNPDNGRMPQIASCAANTNGLTVVGDWINSPKPARSNALLAWCGCDVALPYPSLTCSRRGSFPRCCWCDEPRTQ